MTWKNLNKSEIIAIKIDDVEMLYYIKALKYAYVLSILALQTMNGYFVFPIVMSIGLSGAINKILLQHNGLIEEDTSDIISTKP